MPLSTEPLQPCWHLVHQTLVLCSCWGLIFSPTLERLREEKRNSFQHSGPALVPSGALSEVEVFPFLPLCVCV